MDDALGGGTLLPAVREDLRLVVAMLNNAAYTEDVGKRLHAVAAEFGRIAGTTLIGQGATVGGVDPRWRRRCRL